MADATEKTPEEIARLKAAAAFYCSPAGLEYRSRLSRQAREDREREMAQWKAENAEWLSKEPERRETAAEKAAKALAEQERQMALVGDGPFQLNGAEHPCCYSYRIHPQIEVGLSEEKAVELCKLLNASGWRP